MTSVYGAEIAQPLVGDWISISIPGIPNSNTSTSGVETDGTSPEDNFGTERPSEPFYGDTFNPIIQELTDAMIPEVVPTEDGIGWAGTADQYQVSLGQNQSNQLATGLWIETSQGGLEQIAVPIG